MPTGQGLSWRKNSELIECDLKNKSKELLERNPYGKVPVLIDGDAVIYESAIINEYLEEKYPQIPLMPKDPCGARGQGYGSITATRACSMPAVKSPTILKSKKSAEELKKYLATLNSEMEGRQYIVGDYSLADITYIPFFVRKERYKATIDDSLPH